MIGIVLPLLLPTPTIRFSLDHKRNISDGAVRGIGMLFSLDHKIFRKQKFTSTGSKGHSLRFVIGGFRTALCVSVYQGLLLVFAIVIDGSEKCN